MSFRATRAKTRGDKTRSRFVHDVEQISKDRDCRAPWYFVPVVFVHPSSPSSFERGGGGDRGRRARATWGAEREPRTPSPPRALPALRPPWPGLLLPSSSCPRPGSLRPSSVGPSSVGPSSSSRSPLPRPAPTRSLPPPLSRVHPFGRARARSAPATALDSHVSIVRSESAFASPLAATEPSPAPAAPVAMSLPFGRAAFQRLRTLRPRGGHSKGGFFDNGHHEAGGNLFGEAPPPPGEPRKWESWEATWCVGISGALGARVARLGPRDGRSARSRRPADPRPGRPALVVGRDGSSVRRWIGWTRRGNVARVLLIVRAPRDLADWRRGRGGGRGGGARGRPRGWPGSGRGRRGGGHRPTAPFPVFFFRRYLTLGAATAILYVGLKARPDTGYYTAADREAKRRLEA